MKQRGFITMDRSCQAQLMAEAAGKPVLSRMRAPWLARKQVGNPARGLVPVPTTVGPDCPRAARSAGLIDAFQPSHCGLLNVPS